MWSFLALNLDVFGRLGIHARVLVIICTSYLCDCVLTMVKAMPILLLSISQFPFSKSASGAVLQGLKFTLATACIPYVFCQSC